MPKPDFLEKIRALPRRQKSTLILVLLIVSTLLVFSALDFTVSSRMKSLAGSGDYPEPQSVWKENASAEDMKTLSPLEGLLDNFKNLKNVGMEKTAGLKLENRIVGAFHGVLGKMEAAWKKTEK